MNKRKDKFEVGDTICVTSRRCSEKVQPHIHKGMLFVVMEVNKLKSGSVSLLCHRRGKESCTFHINEDRFDLQKVSEKEIETASKVLAAKYKEQLEKEVEKQWNADVKKSFYSLKSKFSFAEHMQISFVPLVIAELAFEYAMKARQWCADNKISEVKGLSRALIDIRHKYEMSLLRDIDQKLLQHIKNEKEKFKEDLDMRKNLILAEPTISNEMYRQFPDITLLPCRVYATISIMLIRVYSRHNEKMNKMIRSRIPCRADAGAILDNKFIVDSLFKCVDAYRGYFEMKETAQTQIIERIVEKCIANSEMLCVATHSEIIK